jgi:hypothetical protein
MRINNRLFDEYLELLRALSRLEKAKELGCNENTIQQIRLDILNEASDVGNFAMMISDVVGALNEPDNSRRKG